MNFWFSNNNEHPIVKSVRERSQYTPDYRNLSQQPRQLLFAYTYKATVLENSPSILSGWSFEKFLLWTNGKDIVPLPAVADGNRGIFESRKNFGGIQPKRIMGRVISLSSKKFVELDKQRENGVPFARQRIRVIVPYLEYTNEQNGGTYINNCESKVTILRAWMYVGVKPHWMTDIRNNRLSPIDTIEKEDKIGEYFKIK